MLQTEVYQWYVFVVFVTGFWKQGRKIALCVETANTEHRYSEERTLVSEWRMVSCNKMSSLETTKKVHNLAGLRTIKVKFVSNIYIALCVTIITSKPVGLVLPAFKVKHLSSRAFIQCKLTRWHLLTAVCYQSCWKFIFLLRYTPINGRCSTYDAWNASSYAWNATWVSSKTNLIIQICILNCNRKRKASLKNVHRELWTL